MKRYFYIIIFLSVFTFWFSANADDDFRVVVNQANTMFSIDQKFLADLFLKNKVFWPDQKLVIVVDLEPTSETRREFSERILDRPVSAVRVYWNQRLYSGRAIPPPELRTEREVVNFVSEHVEAIGYVSSQTDVRSLKVLTIK